MKDGGSAFPAMARWDDGALEYVKTGMSLRDYFAAKALAALIPILNDLGRASRETITPDDVARHAYYYADAMLRAREKA